MRSTQYNQLVSWVSKFDSMKGKKTLQNNNNSSAMSQFSTIKEGAKVTSKSTCAKFPRMNRPKLYNLKNPVGRKSSRNFEKRGSARSQVGNHSGMILNIFKLFRIYDHSRKQTDIDFI